MVNEWTIDDLPTKFDDSRFPRHPWNPSPYLMADLAVWLNEHQPKPEPEPEPDRWRRAHEIVEQERDQARSERDDLQAKLNSLRVTYRNLDARANKIVGRVAAAERERDQARERAVAYARCATQASLDRDQARAERDEAQMERSDAERERDEWERKFLDSDEARHSMTRERDEATVRAEAAEARTTHAVSYPLHQPDGTRLDASHLPIDSNDDPALYVIRESDLPTVQQGEDGDWYPGDRWDLGGDRFIDVRGALEKMRRYAAIARTIEAEPADPVEAKARELWKAADPAADVEWVETLGRVRDRYRRIAAHVLGKEADDE